MRRLIPGFFLLLCMSAGAESVDNPTLPAEFRDALETAIKAGTWSGVSIGMIRGDHESRWYIDSSGTIEDPPATQRGRYELDAISTVYGGVLLGEMASAGVVKLSDRLDRFLPEGTRCADTRVCGLTLFDLAAHRSGLPSLPPNFFPLDAADPFRDYSQAELLDFVRSYRFPDRPSSGDGQALEFGLLGWALSRAGVDYAAALRDRVLEPLRLNRTDSTDGAVVPGRNRGKGERLPRHFLALAPAGALRSDLADQLNFLRLNLKPGDSPLRPALLLARQSSGESGMSAFGLGWQVQSVHSDEQDWPLLWQRGAGGAHASFVGFRSDRQEAVVVLADSTADVARIGLALLRDAPPPFIPKALRTLLPEEAKDYVGLYEVSHGQELIVRRADDGLSVQTRGQLPLRLLEIDADQFVYADMPAQIVFQRDGNKHVESLRISQAGINMPARRLSTGIPVLSRVPIVASAHLIQDVSGTYRVDENTQVRIADASGELRLQFTGTDPRRLLAYAEDRFATSEGDLEVTLRRGVDHLPDAIVMTLFGESMTFPRVTPELPAGTTPAAASGTASRPSGTNSKPARTVPKSSPLVPAIKKGGIGTPELRR
ncbi:MAG: serine hydrolase [Tahibacter sp.]